LWTSNGVRQYLWDGEAIPLERTLLVIRTSQLLFARQGFGLWGVRHGADFALVGFAGFWHFRDPPERELLYGIDETVWGRGHATAAARAVLNYGFNTLEMRVIRASTDVGNVASARVLEKLGFRLTKRAVVAKLDTLFYERGLLEDDQKGP
jgi:RimJ/RimL family protein N-acetyltransferase